MQTGLQAACLSIPTIGNELAEDFDNVVAESSTQGSVMIHVVRLPQGRSSNIACKVKALAHA